MKQQQQLRSIRQLTLFFMIALLLSGITAFPLASEMNFLSHHADLFPATLGNWIIEVSKAVSTTDPKVLYGTDWLAFAHIIIASFFLGVYKDPVKNHFIVQIGIFACIAIFPTAFICGAIRGIPVFHQLIDCMFGVIGLIPLLMIDIKIKQLDADNQNSVITVL